MQRWRRGPQPSRAEIRFALEEVGRFREYPHQLQDGIADLGTLEVWASQVFGRLVVFSAAISSAEVADIAGGALWVQGVDVEGPKLMQGR
ncbi:MAG: hypothetical protein AAB337_00935 [Patescibacteria group bacterium]